MVALNDTIFIQNFTGEHASESDHQDDEDNIIQIDFNKGRRDVDSRPSVTCVTFDRSGEAIAAGSQDNLVSIFNVERGCRIRNLKCHSELISDISWCRSLSQPYIIATGSFDCKVAIHDVRQRNSTIRQIEGLHQGVVTRVLWNCNNSCADALGSESDEKLINLASTGYNGERGELAVWNLRDIITGCFLGSQTRNQERVLRPVFFDNLSHLAAIKAVAWNPHQKSLIATGGLTSNDPVIRLFDINNLSPGTLRNDNISKNCHDDVLHSIHCNSPINSICWRRSAAPSSTFKLGGNHGSQELLTTHDGPDYGIKLWQIDEQSEHGAALSQPTIPDSSRSKKTKYWFTKVKEWHDAHDGRSIINS